MRTDDKPSQHPPDRPWAPIALLAVIALAALSFPVAAAAGASARGLERQGLVALAVVAPAASLAAAGWQRDRRRAERRVERGRSEHGRLERALQQRDAALRTEHRLIQRLEQSRRAEREWNRELRSQLQRLYERGGVLIGGDDARELILRAAVELLEAEKGLLLESADVDADGDLDLALSHGFEHDPEHSALAQRFARQVLERDQTIRENDPFAGRPDDELTPADHEISNLVAIPLYLRDRFHGVVVVANRPGGFEEVEDDLLLALGDHAGAALQSGHLRRDLRESHKGTVRMLLEALAARDLVLHRQAAEAAVLADALARELALEDRDRDVLVLATLLRDVGYLALPDRLLLQPGPLDVDERAVVELHPRIGFRVLRQLPVLRDVAYTVLYHHEHHDGCGYPFGIAGDEIPVPARALAVIDAYTSITHDRPYRPARDSATACEELVEAAGTQFDPEITALFTECVRRRPRLADRELAEAVLEAVPLGAMNGEARVLGALTEPDVDALTLLGSYRAFHDHLREALDAEEQGDLVVVVMLQLEELARLNEESGYFAGDRLIQAAARDAERVAARVGGSAYRVAGRRLAVVASCSSEDARTVVDQVQIEILGGPSTRVAIAFGGVGDRPEEVIERARAALRPAVR